MTTTEDPLSGLMTAVARGDQQAFAQVAEAVQDRLRAFLAARAPDVGTVEEVLQDTLITVWRRRADFRAEQGSVSAWVIGIARFRLSEELRRRRRQLTLPLEAFDAAVIDACLAADEGEEPDLPLARLQTCLGRLDEPGRALVQARYGEGLTLAELAARVGRPAERLAVTLFRLRRVLAECLQRGPA
jgi:RNA polymerase sigma-70 factor (ECF subfamily)